MDCQICCYKYTSKARRKYTCLECSESVCTCCVFKHMMENIGDLKCMFCNDQIIITDLRGYLSATKYKKITEKEVNILFQKDITFLDATKVMLNEEQRIIEMETMTRWMRKDGMIDEQIYHTLNEMGYMEKSSKRTLTHLCPKCNTFLWNDTGFDYTCEGCNITICCACIEEKNVNHVCDEQILETLKYIHINCEMCPKCNTVIEKEIGGCDQMFCIKCKTTFSWTTRRIVTKGEAHHNPHFYEWQREQRSGGERNPLDNPCEGHFLMKCQNDLDSATILPETLETITLKTSLSVNKGTYLRFVQGILLHSIETIVSIQERDDFIKQQFRARYLTKRLNFKRWKIRFRRHINTLRRNNETKTLLMTCLDGLYYIVLAGDASDIMLEHLFKFITLALKDVQNMYGRTFNYKIGINQIVLPYMI